MVQEPLSHDGTPCFSAWEDCKAVEKRHAKWVSNGRPKYSIQIYDTTPNSNDPQHIKALAEHLHKATLETRGGDGDTDYDDRLDVYVLALPADLSDEGRVN